VNAVLDILPNALPPTLAAPCPPPSNPEPAGFSSFLNGEQVAAITDHQMDFEAIAPARAGLAPFSQFSEDLVRLDPQVVADLDRGRVNEGDACAKPKTRVQVKLSAVRRSRFAVRPCADS
jgi:hypothetical protein